MELPRTDIDHLMGLVSRDPSTELVVDLPAQKIAVSDGSWSRQFDIDPFRKYRLLRGLDDISMTLEYLSDIEAYESSRPAWVGGQ